MIPPSLGEVCLGHIVHPGEGEAEGEDILVEEGEVPGEAAVVEEEEDIKEEEVEGEGVSHHKITVVACDANGEPIYVSLLFLLLLGLKCV